MRLIIFFKPMKNTNNDILIVQSGEIKEIIPAHETDKLQQYLTLRTIRILQDFIKAELRAGGLEEIYSIRISPEGKLQSIDLQTVDNHRNKKYILRTVKESRNKERRERNSKQLCENEAREVLTSFEGCSFQEENGSVFIYAKEIPLKPEYQKLLSPNSKLSSVEISESEIIFNSCTPDMVLPSNEKDLEYVSNAVNECFGATVASSISLHFSRENLNFTGVSFKGIDYETG